MTSCDRSPRNAPALSLLLPRASRVLSLDRAGSRSSLRPSSHFSLSLSLSLPFRARARLCTTAQSHHLALFTEWYARETEREKEGEREREREWNPARDSRLAAMPSSDRERENVQRAQAPRICIYLPGCYLRGGKSTPRECRLPRREGRSERAKRISSPRRASSASAPLLHPCGIRGCTALPNVKHVCARKALSV